MLSDLNYYPALLFAFEYSIMYTASLTLARVYHYDALKIGLVLLAFGSGGLHALFLKNSFSNSAIMCRLSLGEYPGRTIFRSYTRTNEDKKWRKEQRGGTHVVLWPSRLT